MDNKKELIYGGLFVSIASVCAVGEMIAGGVCLSSVFGCVKDIFGALIDVVLLACLVMKSKKPKNIAELLEREVEKWGDDNSPLIFKITSGYQAAKEYDYCKQGFCLLAHPNEYPELSVSLKKDSDEWKQYSNGNKGNRKTGKLFEFPAYNTMTEESFKIHALMTQEHFDNADLENTVKNIVFAINSRFNEYGIKANKKGKAEFIIECTEIKTKEDIEHFVGMLDYTLSLIKVVA